MDISDVLQLLKCCWWNMKQFDLIIVIIAAFSALDLCSAFYYLDNNNNIKHVHDSNSDNKALADILYEQTVHPEKFAHVKPKYHHGWGHHGEFNCC